MLGRLIQAIRGKFASSGPRLLYEENGRDGRLWYQDGATSFSLYWGFGGTNVLVTIDVPRACDWEKETKLPLAQRDEVLRFIARQVIEDKTSFGRNRYEIGPDSITIYM